MSLNSYKADVIELLASYKAYITETCMMRVLPSSEDTQERYDWLSEQIEICENQILEIIEELK